MSKLKNDQLLFNCIKLISLFLLAITIAACQPALPERVTYSGPIMGTDYRITLILQDQQKGIDIESQLIAEMELVNSSMSTYIDDSEVNRFNRIAKNKPFELSAPLLDVITQSQVIAELSNGSFDITIGKAVNLWGFGPKGLISKAPTELELNALKASTGYQNLVLQDSTLTKKNVDTEIDLSAIAKGFAVDQVANKLNSLGIDNYLIDIGGELRASGQPLADQQWRIGIEKPHDLGGIQQIISLSDKSIATSGDYRNYHTIDGERFSHTIDTNTLKPVFHRLALVSVIANEASTADALATAIMAMGETQGLIFSKQHNLAVYMVIRQNSEAQYEVVMTDEFAVYLQ